MTQRWRTEGERAAAGRLSSLEVLKGSPSLVQVSFVLG